MTATLDALIDLGLIFWIAWPTIYLILAVLVIPLANMIMPVRSYHDTIARWLFLQFMAYALFAGIYFLAIGMILP